MPYRTSVIEVKKIVKVRPTKIEVDALNAGIKTANVLMNKVVAPLYDSTDDTDVDLMAEIEKYLAAHFFCIFKPQRESEKAGSVWEKKMSKVDLRLELTHYGQQALVLDVLGGLSGLNSGALRMSLTWLGTEYE